MTICYRGSKRSKAGDVSTDDLPDHHTTEETRICMANREDLANSSGGTLKRSGDNLGEHDAIDELRAALEKLQLGIENDHRALRATQIGLKSIRLFKQHEAADVLNIGVEAFEEALKLTPKNDAKRPDALNNLSNALYFRFRKSGSESDLTAAIKLEEEAVKETPRENREDLATYLFSLGNFLTSRFESSTPVDGLSGDLDAATKSFQEAVEVSFRNDPNRPVYLLGLGASLRDRFKLLGLVDDWNAAVKAYREAANSASQNGSLRASLFNDLNVVIILRLRMAVDKSETEWDAAVQATEEQQINGGDTASRPIFLASLGSFSLKRFENTGSMKALNLSVTALREADRLVPEDHPRKFATITNLGGSLQHRFEMTGSAADLNEAISAHRKSSQLILNNHPFKSAVLDNIGGALSRRAEITGSIDDLNEAIESLVTAVELDTTDSRRRGYRLNNLAGALLERYERTSDVEDLKEAVNTWQRSVDLIPRGDQERPGILSSLANGLRAQFDWFRELKYLDASIQVSRQAVDETPENYPYKGGHLNNLGNAFQRRAKQTGLLRDINDAVEALRSAVEATPKDHHERPAYLNNLCSALQLRYKLSRNTTSNDLDEAINIQQQVLKLMPQDHPGTGTYLFTLGEGFRMRFESSKSLEDRNNAVDAYERSVRSTSSYPQQRIKSAREAADLIYSEDSERASRMLTVAVDLLPLTNPRTGQRDAKQVLISQSSGLGSECCSSRGSNRQAILSRSLFRTD